jgi:hypothetical protein
MTPRRFILALVLGAAVAAAPALAGGATAPAPEWHDAGANLGSDVSLSDVAAIRVDGKDVVLAVGNDAHGAVLYRYANDTWQGESIAGLPPGSALTKVALTPQAAWAVGSADGQPLVVRFAGTAPELASGGGVFKVLSPDTALGVPSSIALAGQDGYLGDTAGHIYPVRDDGGESARINPALPAYPPSGTVNGFAIYQGGAFAVSGGPMVSGTPDSDVRIYQMSGDKVQAATFQPAPATSDLGGVIASGSTAALAIESGVSTSTFSPATWQPDANGVWKRDSDDATRFAFGPTGTELRDVDAAWPVQGIAGRVGNDGMVWLRATAGGAWATHPAPGTPFAGLAVLAADDVWAVGPKGTLKHLYVAPPLEATTTTTAETATTDATTSTTTATTTTDTTTQTTTPPPDPPSGGDPPSSPGGASEPAPVPAVEVDQPPATSPPAAKQPPAKQPPAKPAPPQKLLSNVVVKLHGHSLVISFSLSAPARVGVRARTGRRVTARAPMRTFAAGQQSLTVRFRGHRPPTKLKLVVRPAEGSA